jgi:hypothetical protein
LLLYIVLVCYDYVMMTILVHFDGRVLVPDEPIVDLPIGIPLVASVAGAAAESMQAAKPADREGPNRWCLIRGLDAETVREIGNDPAFDLENA